MDEHAVDEVSEREQQFAVTLHSIGDGVIATDATGCVTLMNPVAERLTGYVLGEATGKPLEAIFKIVNQESRRPVENPVKQVLREGIVVGLANHTLLIAKDGTEYPIADSAAPIVDTQRKMRGVVLVFRDQTEERNAEIALRESEERLHLLIDGVKDYALYMLDPQGYIVSWNMGAQRIKGYEASEIIGQHISRLFTPEDAAAGKPQHNLEVAAREGRYEEESWRQRKDGSRFWANTILTALRDQDGELRGFAKITRDLTTRRAAEERERELIRAEAARAEAETRAAQLRESEERYREANQKLSVLLSALDAGITMQDAEGRLVFANEAATALLGYSDSRALLQASTDEISSRYSIFDESGAPLPQALLPGRQVLDGAPAQERVIGFRLNATGEQRWSLVSASPVYDSAGGVQFAINIFRDITEKRRQELRRNFIAQATAELSTSFEYQVTLATLARLAVPRIADWCAVDILEGTVLERLAVEHRDPDKVASVKALGRRHPLDLNDLNAKIGIANVLRTGEPELAEEIPQGLLESLAVDDEHLRLIQALDLRSYIAVPLRARGRTLGVLTFAMAESGRRYNQEDLTVALQLADRAAVAIDNARLLRESHQARTEAEQANRSKDEFMAILGHELRNPLAPIVTALQLMKLREPDTFSRERAIIERQIKHLVRLVDDLLDISRITRGKVELHKEPLAISDVVAQALETASPMLEERRHELTVNVPKELRVLGDEVRLGQVIGNLLNNAAKYTAPGGRISITAERVGDTILVRVSDNGMGIAPEMLPHIFDLFVQERQTLARSQGGLGLGLSIARSLIQLHGGSISGHSAGLGQGTEICVRLPALDAELQVPVTPRRAHSDPKLRAPGGAKILIVDDNADAAQLLAQALNEWGHEVHIAHDGLEGLELAEKLHPSVAILDIGLPVMDGYELARRIRALPGMNKINLLAITGYGQPSDRARALEAGFDAHLVKPIRLLALQTALMKLLHPEIQDQDRPASG